MIRLKSPQEITTMAEGGKISARVLRETLAKIKPGVTTITLDEFAERRIKELKAFPSFKGFEGYEYSTCININDGIVHGIPGDYKIKDGDVVSVDLGVLFDGFHTDTSWTVVAGQGSLESEKFLQAGRAALEKSVKACRAGNRIGDISAAMQSEVEKAGYNVVRDLVGHGVGRKLHEEPQVPCYGRAGTGIRLEEGLVIAIEVIYASGSPKLKVLPDGWTMATKDATISGLFEQTVAIEHGMPRILTAGWPGAYFAFL